MKIEAMLWPAVLCASAAVAGYINEPPNPPSIPPGNLYMAGSSGDQAEDSGVVAESIAIGLTSHGDSNYTLLSTDRAVQVSAPLTAPRTWTLPCAGSMAAAGQSLQVIDPGANLSPNFPLTIIPQSGCTTANTLNGAATNSVQLLGRGSRAIAINDKLSNWSVTVVRQPQRTLDFTADFGGVPATAIGTSDCPVTASSTTVTCNNTTLTKADEGDVFEAQAIALDGKIFISKIDSVSTTDPHTFTLHDAPQFTLQDVKVIDTLFVCDPSPDNDCTASSGYAFGSTQTLPTTGTSGDIPAKAHPALMTIVDVQIRNAGSGGPNGPVLLALNPTGYPNALHGAQAIFSGTISGGALTAINHTPVSGALYRLIDSSYTYDSSGYYESIPVTAGSLTGATVDIKFAVVTEVITNDPNVYQPDGPHPMPCDKDTATAMDPISGTTDHGTGLMVTCGSHKPLVSFGKDNVEAIKAVNDYITTQNGAFAPVCIAFSGRFLSTPIDLAAEPGQHLIKGAPCLLGDAQILSGIFIFPAKEKAGDESGDLVVFPIVDANGNGSSGPVQSQVVNADPNGKPVMAGTFITNLTFWGDWSSPFVQNAIKFYGFTQWVTVANLSSWNVRGCLICVGVDTPGSEEDSPEGQIAESTFFNLRTEFTGDPGTAGPGTSVPAFGLDGIGNGSNSPNNVLILRYRAYDNNGISLTIRPCTKNAGNEDHPGTGAHQLTVSALKVEESNMEYSPNSTDAVQVGATVAECNGVAWGQSNGTIHHTHGVDSQSGVHGLTFIAPNIVNPGVGTAAFRFKGCNSADLQSMRILGGLISATGSEHGMGLVFNVSKNNNVADLVTNSTTDYNLIYHGAIENPDCGDADNVKAGGLEYDAHDNATTALIDTGKTVMTVLRCGLNQALPLSGCDGATGQLVDTGSSQTLTNKNFNGSYFSGLSTGVTCRRADSQLPNRQRHRHALLKAKRPERRLASNMGDWRSARLQNQSSTSVQLMYTGSS